MARRNRAPLTEAQRKQRLWIAAIAAAVILVGAVIGLVLPRLTSSGPEGTAAPTSTPDASAPSETNGPVSPGDVVDAGVVSRGWLPQPITEDPRVYGEAAAVALASYDTTLATRDDFINYLATWHTVDSRLTSDDDRLAGLKSSVRLIGQWMIPSTEGWDAQALSKTALTATVVSSKLDDELLSLKDDPSTAQYVSQGQHIVTSEIVVTTSAQDSSTGDRTQFDQRFTISVRLMCGNSVPPAGSGQDASSCMILNYLKDPVV